MLVPSHVNVCTAGHFHNSLPPHSECPPSCLNASWLCCCPLLGATNPTECCTCCAGCCLRCDRHLSVQDLCAWQSCGQPQNGASVVKQRPPPCCQLCQCGLPKKNPPPRILGPRSDVVCLPAYSCLLESWYVPLYTDTHLLSAVLGAPQHAERCHSCDWQPGRQL